MHPPSVPLVNLLVRFSKTFLNIARHLKLTQSLNVELNWETNQLRRTRRHSNSIGHQLSKRLYSGPLEPALRPVALLAFCQLPEVTQATGLLPTQSLRLGPDWTTKPCGSVLLFGSASMSALHTSVDVGLLSNQTSFIHFHAISVLVDFSDTPRSTTS